VPDADTDPATDGQSGGLPGGHVAGHLGGRNRADLRHELGNRLASIVAFSHLIQTDPRLPAELHDQAELLIEEADRTRALVEELLELEATPTPASVAAVASPPARPARSSGRILVVDDEPAIRDFLSRILARIGYEPVVAADGDAALAIVRSAPPDAILCDHRMAGMSGTAFHEIIAETSPDLARRFAFMSGDVTSSDVRATADARGVVLLGKPFDIDSVERTVARLLGA
jgi:CheY-like chemotaxis protein